MNLQLQSKAVQEWLEQRSSRERIFIFVVGIFLLYTFWELIFELGLQHERGDLVKQRQTLVEELALQNNNVTTLKQILTSAAFTRSWQKQQNLKSRFNQAGNPLLDLEQTYVPLERLPQVSSAIIAKQEEVLLISMKTFSAEPWLPAKNSNNPDLSSLQRIDKQSMELSFRGSYFNTIAFLEHLEQLPWHLYWERLDYQVLTYPEAKVVARFYVLSKQRS